MRRVVALILLALAGPAAALDVPCGGRLLDNPLRSWNLAVTRPPIAMGINSTVVPTGGGLTRSQIEGATIAAVQAWNVLRTGLVHAAVDSSCPRGFAHDGKPCISYEDPAGTMSGGVLAATVIWADTGGTHGCTTPDVGAQTFSDIDDGDIVFADGWSWTLPTAPGSDICLNGCNKSYDLEGVATHEMGHVLGIDHSANEADTMFASFSSCDCSKSSLSACDIQAGSNLCYGTGCQ